LQLAAEPKEVILNPAVELYIHANKTLLCKPESPQGCLTEVELRYIHDQKIKWIDLYICIKNLIFCSEQRYLEIVSMLPMAYRKHYFMQIQLLFEMGELNYEFINQKEQSLMFSYCGLHPKNKMKVAIVGKKPWSFIMASWLYKAGFHVTIVELAPRRHNCFFEDNLYAALM